jgi:hypothetical protein
MTVTRERFNQGMTYDEFKAKLSRAREQYERSEELLDMSEEDLAPFHDVPHFDALVIVTETCPDVITNLPILVRIAESTGKIDVRVFFRDENKDLMAQFMNGPYESVPVFAFYDADFALRGVFIERPRSVTEMRTQRTMDLHQANPEFGAYGASPAELAEEARDRLRQATQRLREDTATFYRRETIRELRELLMEISKPGSELQPRWTGNLAVAVPA